MNAKESQPTPTPAAAPVSAAKFQVIRSARAFEEIAQQIRTELSQGRLKVGTRLPSERALSEQFGVSRNTLREALRSLEHAGLIRLQKGATGGAFISGRSGDAIATGLMDMYHMGAIQPEQLTEARIWLESILVREACARATPADIEALSSNIDAAEEATRKDDFPARAATNLEFHRILARMTGNPIMVIVMNGVLNVLAEFIGQVGHYENAYVLPSRRRFVKHLAARDSDAAVAEMESILKRLQRSYLSKIEGGDAQEAEADPAAAKARPKPAAKAAAKPAAKSPAKPVAKAASRPAAKPPVKTPR
ncbi:FadR/GntR family transcriptional regulator [Variovorax sp. GB1R11]|uniref:FadR/GntR family transcriptional regulator n=1 Tax=Variovorax sp. GB1R11 TaxID=3443741 RepID=UPI003F467D13